ncbi:ferritin-like domain-containing protein [Polyangium jinanense]|uniref:Ferritin-like domain-containing protein n=1 Tax=Polyangium jinanense TaxID=2829994 RepID=A0A9X3X8E6_9BACT|nr:ferritin-like domain-containing protein [Polyangium jinanense]MDC3959543.1 ferritin-like domain-containing protein [Polyangium jinanense]MDC3986142.1 ferritin-like domain-containing protein [Polyangium jinanense]
MADVEATTARCAAAQIWRHRARAELEASARFTRLAGELAACGAVAPVITMAREAAEDERRHAEQCAALVRELGGKPFELGAVPAARVVTPSGLGPRERLHYEVIAMSCVTETLSAALLGELVARATDPLVRDTMQHILRDEVDHARLGWAHLAAEHERGAQDVVGPSLPAMLAGTVSEELFSSWAEHPAQEALSGLGALDRAERKRIFRDTMSLVVFPGLRRFGVDTARGESWLSERLP